MHADANTRRVRDEAPVIVAGAVYLIAFTGYGVITGARLTIAYAVIVIVLGVVLSFVHLRVGFSRPVLWAFAAWGFLHMAGGLIEFPSGEVLYNIDWGVPVVRYDRLIHAFGFGTSSVACAQAMRGRMGVTNFRGAAAFIVWLAGMGVGALNEMVEFWMSQVTTTNVGGFVNTGWDLVANTLGTAIAAFWVSKRYR
jgi:hypothetical protein